MIHTSYISCFIFHFISFFPACFFIFFPLHVKLNNTCEYNRLKKDSLNALILNACNFLETKTEK